MGSNVIAAIGSFKELEKALSAPVDKIFILDADLLELKSMLALCRKKKKEAYIHIDLIRGLSDDEAAVHFLAREVKPAGVISTRLSSLKTARKLNLQTIQRFFILDSRSLNKMMDSIEKFQPDYIELLPGLMPQIIEEIVLKTKIPIIAGGLIRNEADMKGCLDAGAAAISTSEERVWFHEG